MKRRDLKSRKGITVCSFPATKPTKKTILTESLLERDFCYHLEMDDNVVAYESQPEQIRYFYQGAYHNYTADFLVHLSDGTKTLYEVKDTRFLNDEVEAQLDAVCEYANASGYQFEIVTEKRIRARPHFTNLKHLCDAKASSPLPRYLEDGIINLVRINGTMRIADILNQVEISLVDIYRLIALNVLYFNVHSLVLGLSSKVTLNDE